LASATTLADVPKRGHVKSAEYLAKSAMQAKRGYRLPAAVWRTGASQFPASSSGKFVPG
jgi:hypothetical protein